MTYMSRFLPLLSLATCLGVNYAYPHYKNKSISDNSSGPITPASWAFSIWGLIYTCLLYLVIQQALGKAVFEDRVVALFVLTCILNSVWIIQWINGDKETSLAVLIALGCVLFAICTTSSSGTTNTIFAIYFGWVLSAMILNTTLVLKDRGSKDDVIALIGLVGLTVVHLLYLGGDYTNKYNANIAVLIVGIWTAVAMYAKHPKYGKYALLVFSVIAVLYYRIL